VDLSGFVVHGTSNYQYEESSLELGSLLGHTAELFAAFEEAIGEGAEALGSDFFSFLLLCGLGWFTTLS